MMISGVISRGNGFAGIFIGNLRPEHHRVLNANHYGVRARILATVKNANSLRRILSKSLAVLGDF